MKDSILVGAANAAGVQSKDNYPCGSTTTPKKFTGTKVKNVDLSNQDRKPKLNKNFEIGLNTTTLIAQKSNQQGKK